MIPRGARVKSLILFVVDKGQPRPVASTVLGGLPAAVQAMTGGVSTPASTIRLTMPAATATARQRSPAMVSAPAAVPQVPQVLKVMGTQPGSIPQIITLSSPRAVSIHFILFYIFHPNLTYLSYCYSSWWR